MTLTHSSAVYSQRARRLSIEECEARVLLAVVHDVGALRGGIAVADDAEGSGFVMYSEQPVQVRFGDIPSGTAEHFIAVRYENEVWQYNNDTEWMPFAAAASDTLVARADFSSDSVQRFEKTTYGTLGRFAGINAGYAEGDVHFVGGRFGGAADAGEIEVLGSYFSTARYVDVGSVGGGVAVSDDATGVGYLMYSESPVSQRFRGVPADNAEHFVAVRVHGGVWEYNNDQRWMRMKPQVTDTLVARLDFDLDTIEPLINDRSDRVAGIGAGYSIGDLNFQANRFNGGDDIGEFEVAGTYFQRIADVQPTTSHDNLRDIAIAMLNHESATQRLPHNLSVLGGPPLLSWRVSILRFLGYWDLYDQFHLHEPWDSPHNIQLVDQMPAVYRSPNFAVPQGAGATPHNQLTVFQMLSGENTILPGDGTSRIGIGDVTDDLKNTVLVVEADADRAVIWTRPDDLTFDAANPLDGLGNLLGVHFNVVCGDAETYVVPNDIVTVNWVNMVERNDGGFVDFSNFAAPPSAEKNLRDLGIAALNFEASQFRLPAHAIYSADGTTPLLSWRVAILPYLGYVGLYNQFHLDEPWDSPANTRLLCMMPREFASTAVDAGMTNFLAVVGDETVFPESNVGTRIIQIRDGVASTILFVQASAEEAVAWTRPQDLAFDAANPLRGIGLAGASEFQAVTADASVHSIPITVDPMNFANLLQDDDGEQVEFTEIDPFLSGKYAMRRLARAVLHFESSHDYLPPHAIYTSDGATPLLSWRVALLPYLGYSDLYRQFRLDEPWNSAHNLALSPLMPREFDHPLVPKSMTNYLAVTGDDTAFPLYDSRLTYVDFPDGLSQTALFVQANPDQAVEWTRPADWQLDVGEPMAGLGAAHPAGFYLAFASGQVELIQRNVDPAVLLSYFLRNDESPGTPRTVGVLAPWVQKPAEVDRAHRNARAAVDYVLASSKWMAQQPYLPATPAPLFFGQHLAVLGQTDQPTQHFDLAVDASQVQHGRKAL